MTYDTEWISESIGSITNIEIVRHYMRHDMWGWFALVWYV